MDLSLFWLSILTAVLGGLILAELSAWSPRIATKLTAFAARRMPISKRARYREEWLAYLADMPTGFSKLVAALGLVVAAERDRMGKGLHVVWAIRDYFIIRRLVRPYLAEARTFGGGWLSLRLRLQPCGNRHFVVSAVFPAAAVPYMREYRECLTKEACNNGLDLSGQRTSIIEKAREAITYAVETNDGLHVGTRRVTGFVLPEDRDVRGMRTLLVLIGRRRLHQFMRRYMRVAAPRGWGSSKR